MNKTSRYHNWQWTLDLDLRIQYLPPFRPIPQYQRANTLQPQMFICPKLTFWFLLTRITKQSYTAVYSMPSGHSDMLSSHIFHMTWPPNSSQLLHLVFNPWNSVLFQWCRKRTYWVSWNTTVYKNYCLKIIWQMLIKTSTSWPHIIG
jgi:hypothetical protein